MPGITTAGIDAALGVLDGTLYVSAHDGPPDSGSLNEANVTRQATTFSAAGNYGAVGGRSRANAAEVLFENVEAGTYQAWSVWTAETAGECLWVVPFATNRTLDAGDDLRGPIDAIECYIEPDL